MAASAVHAKAARITNDLQRHRGNRNAKRTCNCSNRRGSRLADVEFTETIAFYKAKSAAGFSSHKSKTKTVTFMSAFHSPSLNSSTYRWEIPSCLLSACKIKQQNEPTQERHRYFTSKLTNPSATGISLLNLIKLNKYLQPVFLSSVTFAD